MDVGGARCCGTWPLRGRDFIVIVLLLFIWIKVLPPSLSSGPRLQTLKKAVTADDASSGEKRLQTRMSSLNVAHYSQDQMC